MPPSQDPNRLPTSQDSDDSALTFEQVLERVERSLQELKERSAQIEKQLEELEFNLESRLFSWAGFKEVFWQAVRFGGLGIAVGWSLAFYTLKNPAPNNTSPAPQTLAP